MKLLKVVAFVFLAQLVSLGSAQAGDFGWLDGLSAQAHVDKSGFRLRLATRFHIGDVKVKAVIGNVGSHADAYMVLRLAEISHVQIDTVIKHYHNNKGKGWGVLAKRLGIKPGSREFHSLKRGHDLGGGKAGHSDKKGKFKDKGKGKGKGKGKK